MSEQSVTEQTVHNILNYYLTRATREPGKYKTVDFTIQIPYEELAKTSGATKADVATYEGSALEVQVKMSWTEHVLSDVEVSIEREEPEYE